MEKTSNRVLKIVCVLALICALMWVVFYAIQTYYVLSDILRRAIITSRFTIIIAQEGLNG